MNQKDTLSKEELAKLREKLLDREWRLNNLYYIVNKDGEKVQFKLNKQQTYLLRNLHYKNFILKARQIGFTTLIDILALDTVLFYPNITAVIIAHTREHAEKIFERIVKFNWDNLPIWLKSAYKLNTESAQKLKFENNNSSIEVSSSARSGTAQFLHISELGPLAQKYPEKAKELITGSLNAVPRKGLVFIESTAKGRDGYFFRMYKLAKKIQEGGKLTEMDYKLFFFPWWDEPSYRLDDIVPIHEEYAKYFEQLEAKGIKLDEFQKSWYIKKSHEMLSEGHEFDEMGSEFPSYPEEAFEASVDGAYYQRQMSQMRKDGRVCRVPWSPLAPVNTYWDLGMNDSMVIIFTQTIGRELRIIDYYENSGEGLAHYVKVLKERPYTYGRHIFPHDIEVKELGTGKSRKEVLWEMGLTNLDVAPKLEIRAGIEAGRNILPLVWIDEGKGNRLVTCLDNYRKEWDDKIGAWKDKAVHDEYSHGADAFRTLAVTYQPHIEMANAMSAVDEVFGRTEEIVDPHSLF